MSNWLTIINQPANVSFGRNSMPLHLRTNNYILSQGAKGFFSIIFTGFPAQNDWLLLRHEGKEYRFTFKLSPQFNYELPTFTSGMSIANYTLLLIEKFKELYIIDKLFDVYQTSTNNIYFTAKEVGSKNFVTRSAQSSGNWAWGPGTWSSQFTTLDKKFVPNYSLWLELFVEEIYKSQKYTSLPPIQGQPDEEGNVIFNVGPRLECFLQPGMPQPTTQKRLENQNNKRYFYKITESFGDSPIPQKFAQSTVRRVLRGGLDDHSHKLFNFKNSKSFITNKRWLSHWPTTREVTEEQPQYLSMLCQHLTNNTLKVYCKVNYADGSTSNEFILHTLQEALNDEIFTLAVGIQNTHALKSMNAANPIKSYTIEARTNTMVIAPKITFKVVQAHFQDMFLLYENSLGAWETLRVNGARKSKTEVSKEEYFKVQDIIATDKKAIFHQMQSYHKKIAVTTGPIDTTIHDLCLEIFISEDIAIVTPMGNLPIEIAADKYDWEDTSQNTRSHEFVIFRSQKDRNYPFAGTIQIVNPNDTTTEVGTEMEGIVDAGSLGRTLLNINEEQ
jgi:hypothetical protein